MLKEGVISLAHSCDNVNDGISNKNVNDNNDGHLRWTVGYVAFK